MIRKILFVSTLLVAGVLFAVAPVSAATKSIDGFKAVAGERTITVHVVDTNDSPVADASVSAWSEAEYTSGTTAANGEFEIAVADNNDDKWYISVFATGYSFAFAHDVEAEESGNTDVTVEVFMTNATVRANLVDANGDAVTLTVQEYGWIYCSSTDDFGQVYSGNIQGLESSIDIAVVAGTYNCEGFVSEKGAVGGTVTVAAGGTAEIDVTVLEFEATVNVEVQDQDGNVVTGLSSFEVFASTSANPSGEDFHGNFIQATGTDGEASFEALDGYTYEVNIFIESEDSFGGPNGGDGGPGGDDGGDSECPEGEDCSDFGDFECPEGQDCSDFGDFGGQSYFTAGSDSSYIQSYSMVQVVADADEPQTALFTVQETDATLEVLVLNPEGDPVSEGFAMALQGDMEDAMGGGDGHGWGSFVHEAVGDDGVAELSVVSGVTYEVKAFTHETFTGEALPPRTVAVTLEEGQTKQIRMQLLEADWTVELNPTVEGDVDLEYQFCYGYSPELGIENFSGFGNNEMPVARGADWYIGCTGYANDQLYRSSDVVYTPGNESGGSEEVDIEMSAAGDFYESTSYVVPAASTATVTLPDGLGTLTIPANSVASEGNLTLTVGTATDYKYNDDNYPITAYEFAIVDSTGQPMTDTFSSNLSLQMPYDEDALADYGIDEDHMVGGGAYNESTGTWESAVSTSVDVDKNTITTSLNHFSTYGILGDRALSTVDEGANDMTVPGQPRAVKAKKLNAAGATLTWKKPADSTVTKYGVQLRKFKVKKQKQWTKLNKVKKVQKKVDGLLAGTKYQFRVRAYNAVGWGQWSAWTKFTTKAE